MEPQPTSAAPRHFRFSLRTLFIAVSVVAVGCGLFAHISGWWVWQKEKYRREQVHNNVRGWGQFSWPANEKPAVHVGMTHSDVLKVLRADGFEVPQKMKAYVEGKRRTEVGMQIVDLEFNYLGVLQKVTFTHYNCPWY